MRPTKGLALAEPPARPTRIATLEELTQEAAPADFLRAARQTDVRCTLVPAATVELSSYAGRPPPDFPSKARQAFFAAGRYQAEPLRLYALREARFFGPSALFGVGDAVARESAQAWGAGEARDVEALFEALEARLGWSAAIEGPARRLEGPHLLAASKASRNHWHWHADILPAFGLLRRLDGVPGLRLLLDTPTGFRSETVPDLPGLEPRPAALFKQQQTVVERLITASTAANHGARLHPEVGEVFREAKARLAPPSGQTGRRIFASRGGGGRRRLVNRAEVERAFIDAGFEVVAPGSLGYAEQIALFDGAEIVVGEHGANLADIGFCRPGARVVELFHPVHNDLCYVSLAAIMGLQHRSVIGTAEAGDDWRLDPAEAVAAALA